MVRWRGGGSQALEARTRAKKNPRSTGALIERSIAQDVEPVRLDADPADLAHGIAERARLAPHDLGFGIFGWNVPHPSRIEIVERGRGERRRNSVDGQLRFSSGDLPPPMRKSDFSERYPD